MRCGKRISVIMKKKEAIEAECKENNNLYRKKLKAGKHENVDF